MSASQKWENMSNEEFYAGEYTVTIVGETIILQETDEIVITFED